jgi:TetR/AcrR family transcriptional regulator, tetracycline repressor protein
MYSCQVMDADPRPAVPAGGDDPPKPPREPDSGDAGRARLSKRTVVERALKLADTDGLDTLTIRKLTQDLGVTPMALYWHFRSKEELLEGMAEQVWSEIEVNVDPAVPWWAQLQKGLESLITALRAHPAAPQLLLEHEKQNEAALRAAEAALEILRGAGFDAQQASEIARSTLWTAITLVMSEPGWAPDLTGEERAEENRRNEIFFAMLPAARYPRLVESAAYMANCDPEFHYRLGAELFIAGIRAMAERQRPDPAGS